MAAIKHASKTITTQASTTSTTYQTVATIAAAATTATNDYIIFAKADISGDSASLLFKARLVRDAAGSPTVLTGSETIYELATSISTHGSPWSYVFLLENIPNETIDFQIAVVTGGTVFADNIVIVAIDLKDDEAAAATGLVRDTDWAYAQNTTATNHVGSFGIMSTRNSVTMTVSSGDEWLVVGCAQIAINTIGFSYAAHIFLDQSEGGIGNNHPTYVMEGEDTQSEQRVHALSRIYTGLSAGSHTWFLQTGDDGIDGRSPTPNQHLFSSIFAINLAKFATAKTAYTEGQIAIALDPSTTEMLTTGAFTPPASASGGTADDFLLMGYSRGQVTGVNVRMRSFIKDSIDSTTPDGSDANTIATSYDPTDQIPLVTMAMGDGAGTDANYPNSEGERTITLVANSIQSGKTQGDRSLVAWPMEMASAGTVPQTVLPSSVPMNIVAVAPAVTFGAITVSPTATPMNVVAVAPTVAAGAITVSPAAAPMNTVAVAPSITLGAATISPAAVPLDLVAVQPAIIVEGGGDQTVEPAAVPMDIVAIAPAVTFGAITISPAAVPMDLVAVAPTSTTSALTISPSPAVADLVAVLPVVVIAPITISPSPVVIDMVAVTPIITGVGAVYVNSGSWTVLIDVADYPSTAVFFFGATLSCDNISSGGRAQLFNLTDGVGVAGSEVTITGKMLVDGEVTAENHVLTGTSFTLTGKKIYTAQHRAESQGDLVRWHGAYVKVVST